MGNRTFRFTSRLCENLLNSFQRWANLYCSHTKPLVDPEVLFDVAKAFEAVNRGVMQHEPVELYGQELWLYRFDGFAIVTRKE